MAEEIITSTNVETATDHEYNASSQGKSAVNLPRKRERQGKALRS